MTTADQPNVLLVVLDAFRSDHVAEYAPTLRRLGDDGVRFENAIAPATWTQPSHASIFTGKYPHEHGVTQPSQSEAPTDLVDWLADCGYSTHGVSGNGFVSPLWNFDRAFDTFRYTQTPEPFPRGMDTYTFLRNRAGSDSRLDLMRSTLNACVSHEHPVQSFGNLSSVATNALVRRYASPLTKIPHQTFAPNPQHGYSPEKNTALLEDIIHNVADDDRPFFAFTNYMDTHRPYNAPGDLQQKHLGRTLSESEFQRLNDDVAAPWEFVRLVQNDAVDEDDVEALRQLYAAAVESVDRHLQRLLDALDEAGIRDETLVIVVGDHGENVGETDSMGRRRFGHEASISDALARVPFVLSHPDLDADVVEKTTSLRSIFELCLQVSDPDVPLGNIDPASFSSDRVICEYPALADARFADRYPDVDDRYIRHRVAVDSIAVYEDDIRFVAESDGTRHAAVEGAQVDNDEVSETLRDFATSVLGQLEQLHRTDVSEETTARLEDLGYV